MTCPSLVSQRLNGMGRAHQADRVNLPLDVNRMQLS